MNNHINILNDMDIINSSNNRNQSNRKILASSNEQLFSGVFGKYMEKNEFNDYLKMLNSNQDIKPFPESILEESLEIKHNEQKSIYFFLFKFTNLLFCKIHILILLFLNLKLKMN